MRLIRTAAGGFLNVERIARLIDARDMAEGWVAVCGDGEEVALAAYYSAAGCIERELPDLGSCAAVLSRRPPPVAILSRMSAAAPSRRRAIGWAPGAGRAIMQPSGNG